MNTERLFPKCVGLVYGWILYNMQTAAKKQNTALVHNIENNVCIVHH